jgi:glutamate synthase domain-containing protein 3
MVRSCHVDTCPVGIATQRPELRAKFAATPAMIENYLLLVAEEVRGYLAALGLPSFGAAVGRSDLLRPRPTAGRAELLDLEPLLTPPPGEVRFARSDLPELHGGELGESISVAPQPAYAIANSDRAVGARLAGRLARMGEPSPHSIRFTGTAGQSFGAFLPTGVEFLLEGGANDYVGKSLSGGRIVVRPPAGDAGDPCLVGNTVLYGATSGELFCAGAAGERLAVRNSGAMVVVEGAGSNACEYMTSGAVVILGDFGRNLAAGMTGGELFVHDPEERLPIRLNAQLVEATPLDLDAAGRLRAILELHVELTGSTRAQAALADWEATAAAFRVIRPKAEVGRIEAEAEGTESGEPDADRGTEAVAA